MVETHDCGIGADGVGVFEDDDGSPSLPIGDPLRVLICDEHDLVRRSLTAKLEESRALEVVAEAAAAGEAVTESLHVAPDVIFVSLVLPQLAGIETIGLISDVMPGVSVVALAVVEPIDERFDALRAGAFGVVDKDWILGSAESTIECLLTGAPFVDAELAEVLLARFDELVADSGVALLTGRERSVLEGLTAGEDLAAIGEDRQMLTSEVQNHVANVLGRLRAGAPLDMGPEAREVLVTAAG